MASQALVDASKAAMAKDYAGALALLEGKIEEPERSSAVAQNILGVCLWKVGRLDEASACLGALAAQPGASAQVAGNYRGVRLDAKVAAITAANDANGDRPPGDAAAAAACAARYEAVDLDDPCTDDIRFHALYNAGLCRLDAGDTGRAAQCFEAALQAKPDFAAAWHNLGEALRLLGDLDGAAHAFGEAKARGGGGGDVGGPSDDEVSDAAGRGLVESMLQAGRYADALAALGPLFAAGSGEGLIEPLYWRGLCRLNTGDAAAAAEDLEKCVVLLETQTHPIYPLAGVKGPLFTACARRGEALLLDGNDAAAALPYFAKAVGAVDDAHAERATARLNLGICRARTGDGAGAAAMLRQLVDEGRGPPDRAGHALGSVLLDGGDYAAARDAYVAATAEAKHRARRAVFGADSVAAEQQESNHMMQSIMRRQKLKMGAATAIRSIRFTVGKEGLRVREDSTVGGAGRTLSSKDMQPNEVAASADGTGLKASRGREHPSAPTSVVEGPGKGDPGFEDVLDAGAQFGFFDALDEIRNNPQVQRKMRDMLQDPDVLATLLMKDPTFKAQVDAFTTSEAAPKNQVSAVLEGRQVPDYEAVPSDDAEDADVDGLPGVEDSARHLSEACCADSETWYQGTEKWKTCAWVAKDPANRCKAWVKSRDGVNAKVDCPVACGTCSTRCVTKQTKEVVMTYGVPRTATTLQNFVVRAFLCAAKAENADSTKTHSLEALKRHAKVSPGWRRFVTEWSFEHPGAKKHSASGDLFGDGAHDAGPPPGAWNQTARELERLWNMTAGSLSYVQLTATVANRGWKIVEDYRPFFDITDGEFSDVVQYIRAWDVLRRCCGPQMSRDYRARLYGNEKYIPHRGPGSVDYDCCEMYDVDAIERELVGLRLFKKCDDLRPLQEGIAWATLDGTFCSRYKEAAIKTGAGFNENPWKKKQNGSFA